MDTKSTTLPVATHSDLFPVYAVGMGETPRERKDKYTPAGEPTFGSGCILRMTQKDGSLRNEKAASVHVIKPAAIYELGVIYKAAGRIYFQPWESNGRVTYSITVEQLVPAETETATGTSRSSSKSEAA